MCKESKGATCLALYDQVFGSLPLDQFNRLMAVNGCPGVGVGLNLPPSPAQLARRAADSILLPAPSGRRSPSDARAYNGFPFTYVNLPTFFWTDAGVWKPLAATASAGGNWATVTAAPMALTFDPGDGDDAVLCSGPGRPWRTSDGNGPATGDACAYTYAKVSGPGYDHPFASTQTITWRLTWVGSGNTAGTLTQRTTSASGVLNVLQVQVVNR